MPTIRHAGRRHARTLALAGAAGAILALAGLAGPAARAAPPGEAVVTIDNFTFSPPVLTIEPGTRVTWVNKDDIPHTVVEEGKTFRSKALDTDDTFTFTFAGAGEFTYFCSLHPHMTGRIIVRDHAS